MKHVCFCCSRTDKWAELRDGLQPPYVTDRVVKTSSSTAFGKILSWETLGSQKAHRCLGLTDLSLRWNSQQLVIICPKGPNRTTQLELETKSGVLVPCTVLNYFVTCGPHIMGDREAERQSPGFKTVSCIVTPVLPLRVAAIVTHSSSWQPFRVGWNHQKWFVFSESRTLPLLVASLLLCMTELHLFGISK